MILARQLPEAHDGTSVSPPLPLSGRQVDGPRATRAGERPSIFCSRCRVQECRCVELGGSAHLAQHRVTSIVTSETHRLPQETGRAAPPPASGFAASCQRGLCPWPAWTAQARQRVGVATFAVKTHGVLRLDSDFRL